MSTRLTSQTLRGIWAALPMSWRADDSFDEEAYRTNIARLCAASVDGIYTTGSTGEFYALDRAEFERMVDVVMEETRHHRIPVQIGCCADDTRDVLRQMAYAAEAGAAGVQVVLPYWMELSDAEMLQFFRDLASAFPQLPLIHYNVPRAKRFLTARDYQKILEVAPNLIGVKFTYAGSHWGELQQALQLLPQLAYFVAEDLLVSAMQLGARGSYSSIACVSPSFMQEMFALATARRWDEALAQQAKVARFFAECGAFVEQLGLSTSDPAFDKGLAIASGFLTGHPRTRAPYNGWSDAGIVEVRRWLQKHYPEFVR